MNNHEKLLHKAVVALKQTVDGAMELIKLYEQGAVEQINAHVKANDAKVLHIKSIVAMQFECSIADLEGDSRKQIIKDARHIAIYLVRKHLPRLSSSTIGLYFGSRDHGTVLNADKRIKFIMSGTHEMLMKETINSLNKLV